MIESLMMSNPETVSAFGITRPRATAARTLFALAASLVLGVWLSAVLFSTLRVVGMIANRDGWTNSNIYNLPNQPSLEEQHRDPAYQAQAMSGIYILGSTIVVFPVLISIFSCYRTRTAGEVFARLKWVFGIFIVAYLTLGVLWSQFPWEQDKSVIDVSSESIAVKVGIFVLLSFAAVIAGPGVRLNIKNLWK